MLRAEQNIIEKAVNDVEIQCRLNSNRGRC